MTDAPIALEIVRTFDAPAASVFRLWADAEERKHWWGPKDFDCTHYEQDFRPGGAWRACISSDRYGESWMSGIFSEIEPDKRIAFSLAWEDGYGKPGVYSQIVVTLAPDGERTLQTFRQTPFRSEADRDSHIGGWAECLDRQAAHVGKA
ncbi:MAG: SRPBCC domain-containing protein [Hyphomonadaceae bacterium]|nr:SRPBCC domain-containing protein [Hyphomonadaceae bacterium]